MQTSQRFRMKLLNSKTTILTICIVNLFSATGVRSEEDCRQPVAFVNIANLSCAVSARDKKNHRNAPSSCTLDLYSDDNANEWYRGDFMGMDDD